MNRPWRGIPALLAVAALLPACASLPPGEGERPLLGSSREYLARGMAEVEAADALRLARSPSPAMGGVFGWPPDYDEWSRLLRQAESDFCALLERFPASPEAPEAQYMLGRILDHPYRNRFDDAVVEYRRVAERFPGTAAAEKARKRVELIESYGK